jgi:hypothetical protein
VLRGGAPAEVVPVAGRLTGRLQIFETTPEQIAWTLRQAQVRTAICSVPSYHGSF